MFSQSEHRHVRWWALHTKNGFLLVNAVRPILSFGCAMLYSLCRSFVVLC